MAITILYLVSVKNGWLKPKEPYMIFNQREAAQGFINMANDVDDVYYSYQEVEGHFIP